MSSNFNINTNFQLNNFDNSISEFNKAFSNSINDANKSLENNNNNFSEIFNSMTQQNNEQMAAIELGVEYFNGVDTINSQKVENLSPTAQVAKDIGSGFSNSINELNGMEKKAEQDFETFASGGDISVHEVMISAHKSNLAMQMAIQLRSQLINAYNEFKNMSI